MTRWLMVIVLLTPSLVGCLGLAEDAGEGGELDRASGGAPKIDPGADQSVIEGTVTDTAIQPLPNANVTVVELGETVNATESGSFSIGPIPPDTYTVTARAPGYLPSQQSVTTETGESTTVSFLLTHLQEKKPFTQAFELKGFMEYGWAVGLNLSGDAYWVRDSNCDYPALKGPNCRGNFDMEPPLETVVFEMGWTPSNPVGTSLYAMMRVRDDASVITGEWEFFSLEGESPLYHRMDRSEIDAVVEEFRERCENGEDQFCGLNFRDRGWPMQTRVWPGWHCPREDAGFCPILQQDYTQVVTAFYNAPAPEGYHVIEDNGPG